MWFETVNPDSTKIISLWINYFDLYLLSLLVFLIKMVFIFEKYFVYLHDENKKQKGIYNGIYTLFLKATSTTINFE